MINEIEKRIIEDWERWAYIIWIASCRCIDSIKDKYFWNSLWWKIKRYFSHIMISWIAGFPQEVRNHGKVIWIFQVWPEAFITYIKK